MQPDPKKEFGSYNELTSPIPYTSLGTTAMQGERHTDEQRVIIETSIWLVNKKIDEILGTGNHLTKPGLDRPEYEFVEDGAKHPGLGGFFNAAKHKIAIVTGNVKDRTSQIKVGVHEYVHFLSHTSRDDTEHLSEVSPIAKKNNTGFCRWVGIDIRKGREGQRTSDYFRAHNEAITEELSEEIFPEGYKTYDEYRGLHNQIIEDAVTRKLGARDNAGIFREWSKDEFKLHIYRQFLKGDLDGYTNLLKLIYKEYDLSEQQLGLMTCKEDLPTLVEKNWKSSGPDGSPPSPTQVAAAVQLRLDNKTPADYPTDIIGPEDSGSDGQNDYGKEFDQHIMQEQLSYGEEVIEIDGVVYNRDNRGYIIYSGEVATGVLEDIRAEFDELMEQASRGSTTKSAITEHIDALLFETYGMSLLTPGFRDFYVYKHTKLDTI